MRTLFRHVLHQSSYGTQKRAPLSVCLADTDGGPTSAPVGALPLRLFLTTAAASRDLNVNGTVPVDFTLTPPEGKIYAVRQIGIYMRDASMSYALFGAITALTNGVDFKVQLSDAVTVTLANVKSNEELLAFAPNANPNTTILTGVNDVISTKIHLPDLLGRPLFLDSTLSRRVIVTVNDDISALDRLWVTALGWIEDVA